jgi:leucyl-tRNA synthetase
MDYIAVHQKWDKFWRDTNANCFDPKSKKQKYYCLAMWPYPSGAGLHLGHAINYAPTDTHARFKRMQGYNVYEPMGFDAFGLPAENHALKTETHPKDNTEKNVANMRRQLESLGCMFDWTKCLTSSEPEYYKWTQWLFVKLFEKGLAYQKEAPVNWCDHCKTVIANEQVVNGECERCHNAVQRKSMKQWFFRITAFAEELLEGLNEIDWPQKTKIMQRNWIGKSSGTRVKFRTDYTAKFIEVFTTRADTLFGVSYLAIAPENPLAQSLIAAAQAEKCSKYIAKSKTKSDIDRTADKNKTGVWTGSYAVNPLNNERVPIWLADYVLAAYGTGAVMGVPAHDERDFDFAKKFNLPIPFVVIPDQTEPKGDRALTEEGTLVHSGKYTGMDSAQAREKITADLEALGMGSAETTYRLRDWSIGRQRYWGAPIPIVYCEKCGTVAETNLPVILPYLKDFKPKGKAPLMNDSGFMKCKCPKCGADARREAETMDTFVCSSFYFLRFLDSDNPAELISAKNCRQFMPVDKYVGGAEHACMHLLYARFIMRFLHSIGAVNCSEPFKSLVHQGMILGPDGTKMSKSRGNIIDPDKYIAEYGSDVLRLYMLFGFNYIDGGAWNDSAFKSTIRYVDRVTNLIVNCQNATRGKKHTEINARDKNLLIKLNQTIKAVTNGLENFSFNTAVARCMELTNSMYEYLSAAAINAKVLCETLHKLVLLLAPMMPHFGEEWFEMLSDGGADRNRRSVFNVSFPAADSQYLINDEIEIAVQINSKIVARITVPVDAEQPAAEQAAGSIISGKPVKKVIYVKNKLINFIV